MMDTITLGLLNREQEQMKWNLHLPWFGPQWMELIHCDDLSRVQRWMRHLKGVLRCRIYFCSAAERGWRHLSLVAVPISKNECLIAARTIHIEKTYE